MSPSIRFSSLLFACALVAAFTAGCTSSTQISAAKSTVQDEAAIRATLTRMNEVLAKRDVAGFLALFDDSEAIMVVGSNASEVVHGRKGVEGFIKWIYSQKFLFGFDLKEVTVRQEGNFAWAYVDGHMLHVRPDGTSKSIPYRFALTLVKRGDQWRWQLFHGSIPRGE